MRIDTDILRGELNKPVEVGETTDEYNKGWHDCTIAVDSAIRRAEGRTLQVTESPVTDVPIPGSDAVDKFWHDTELFGQKTQEVSIIGEPVDKGLIREVIDRAMELNKTVQIKTDDAEIEVKVYGI